jgi:ABC-type nickel/cobalt efflux system permease component RcnA
MVKKIATSLLMFAVAAVFALWLITDLRRAAPAAVWNVVLHGAAALIFIIAGIAVVRTRRSRAAVAGERGGASPRDRDTVLHDDSLTASQNSLLNALHSASKQDSDATIGAGIDPVTGEKRYQLVRRK